MQFAVSVMIRAFSDILHHAGDHEPHSTSAKLKKHNVLAWLIDYIRDKLKIRSFNKCGLYTVIEKERFQLTL